MTCFTIADDDGNRFFEGKGGLYITEEGPMNFALHRAEKSYEWSGRWFVWMAENEGTLVEKRDNVVDYVRITRACGSHVAQVFALVRKSKENYYGIGTITAKHSKMNFFMWFPHADAATIGAMIEKFPLRDIKDGSAWFAIRKPEDAVMFRLTYDLEHPLEIYEMTMLEEIANVHAETVR